MLLILLNKRFYCLEEGLNRLRYNLPAPCAGAVQMP